MNGRQHRDQEDKRRWGSRSSQQRPKGPFRTTVLIFCEGRETEPNYFRSLRAKDNVALSFDVTVKPSTEVYSLVELLVTAKAI